MFLEVPTFEFSEPIIGTSILLIILAALQERPPRIEPWGP